MRTYCEGFTKCTRNIHERCSLVYFYRMNESGYFTIKEASDFLGVSVRAIQGLAKRRGLQKDKRGRYMIPISVVNLWARERSIKQAEYIVANQEHAELITEAFTPDEYAELEKRLQEYPMQRQEIENLKERITDYRNQVQYLQESLEKQRKQQAKIIETINTQAKSIAASIQALQQRNLIEAKDKGYDTTETN